MLEEDARLQDLFLKGEISNFTHHYGSGHFYFSLKDDTASVRAVMFKRHASALRFLPENGMRVIVRASVSLFERDGSFQAYVTDLQPDGEGAVAIAVRQRRERLEKLGVFSPLHKKPIPPYPMRIGVVTSETGAAIGDITQVLGRRWPVARVLFCPSRVQGEGAAAELIAALKTLDGNCDVMIIGRGGGSSEDLWAFQDEALAMAIFRAKTPVISAVGHEMDMTICDLAADLRAPTPSAAAELVAPSVSDVRELLFVRRELLRRGALRLLQSRRERLRRLRRSPVVTEPVSFIQKKRKRLNCIHKALYNGGQDKLEDWRRLLRERAALLEDLSPMRVLSRGYSAVLRGGEPVSSALALKEGDAVELRFHDGAALAEINGIRVGSDASKEKKL